MHFLCWTVLWVLFIWSVCGRCWLFFLVRFACCVVNNICNPDGISHIDLLTSMCFPHFTFECFIFSWVLTFCDGKFISVQMMHCKWPLILITMDDAKRILQFKNSKTQFTVRPFNEKTCREINHTLPERLCFKFHKILHFSHVAAHSPPQNKSIIHRPNDYYFLFFLQFLKFYVFIVALKRCSAIFGNFLKTKILFQNKNLNVNTSCNTGARWSETYRSFYNHFIF